MACDTLITEGGTAAAAAEGSVGVDEVKMEVDEALEKLGTIGRWQILYYTVISTACCLLPCFHMLAIIYVGKCTILYYIFSERELKFMFTICRRPSVCRLSVCLSVTFVRPTQTIEIFGNVTTL